MQLSTFKINKKKIKKNQGYFKKSRSKPQPNQLILDYA